MCTRFPSRFPDKQLPDTKTKNQAVRAGSLHHSDAARGAPIAASNPVQTLRARCARKSELLASGRASGRNEICCCTSDRAAVDYTCSAADKIIYSARGIVLHASVRGNWQRRYRTSVLDPEETGNRFRLV